MKILYETQDKMEDELKSICRKEEITPTDLDNIYKIVDIIKDVTTVEAMHRAEENGYSRESMDNYSRGWDVDYSYARGRDSRGRYTSRDGSYENSNRGRSYEGSYENSNRGRSYEGGYSGHDKEGMIDQLMRLMRNARTEEERENYRKTIEQLER